MAPRPPLLTNLAHWPWRRWLLVIGTLLAVTLAPLGWIQWQQAKLLDDMSTNQVDAIMWQAYQLERELSRLGQTITQAQRNPSGADPYELQARYEVFLSRVDLLTELPRRDLLASSDPYARVTETIERFSALADPLFAEPEALLAAPERLSDLDERIRAMLPALAELTRDANRAGARFLDQRNMQLQKQGALVILLAALQTAAMLLFVGLVEAGEEVLQRLGVHANPAVAHRDQHRRLTGRAARDAGTNRTLKGELDRVVDQVVENLTHPGGIGQDPLGQVVVGLDTQRQAFVARRHLHQVVHLLHQVEQGDGCLRELERARLHG